MKIDGLPNSIDRTEILKSLVVMVIDPNSLVTLSIGLRGVTATVYALDTESKYIVSHEDEAMTHTVVIPYSIPPVEGQYEEGDEL